MNLKPASSLRAELFKRQIQSSILILMLLGTLNLAQLIFNYWVDVNQRLDQQATTLQLTLIPAIQFQDHKEAAMTLDSLNGDSAILRASVEIAGKHFAGYASHGHENGPPLVEGFSARSLVKTYVLRDKDEILGVLHLERSYDDLIRSLAVFAFFIIAMVGIGLVVSITFARIFRRIVMQSFQTMTDQMEVLKTDPKAVEITSTSISPFQEISNVLTKFNSMALALKQRDFELLTANSQLETKINERTEQLRELQAKMLEEAHKAGMADTAASILHNFGNIMSSLNIDASSLNEFIRGSRIADSLRQLHGLLSDPDKVAAVIGDRQKLSALVTFVDCLVTAEKSEQESSLHFLKRIREETDLMKGLIQYQQTYVDSPKFFQSLPIREVMDIAVGLKDAALKNKQVTVHLDFPTNPVVLIQKAKFIHVITNLIVNAIQAMDHTPAENRMIHISGEVRDGTVSIIFRDFGPGIEGSNARKIFQQGFTTKKDGHGFGLHSSANYMVEMHGKLELLTPQPPVGTAFVITLQQEGFAAERQTIA